MFLRSVVMTGYHFILTNRAVFCSFTSIGIDDNSRAYRRSVKPYQDCGRLNLVEFFSTPVEGVMFLPCIGHSLGQACIKITSEGESIIYAADVFRTKVSCSCAYSGAIAFWKV